MPESTSGIRFIKVGTEIVNLSAIAYVFTSPKYEDATIVLNVNNFNGKAKTVHIPKAKVQQLLDYLTPMTELAIQIEGEE